MYALDLISRYYPDETPLRHLLLTHSGQVTRKALCIVDHHPELHANRELVLQGAMLHDIGIFKTNAPSIHCHVDAPYLLHGYLGAEILRKEGHETLARICERHTGTGLTRQNIIDRNLPLPAKDFLPESIEEKIICYADKFYSKSHPERMLTVAQAAESLRNFGAAGVEKFLYWSALFE